MFDIGYTDSGAVSLTGRFDAAQCDKVRQFLGGIQTPDLLDFKDLEYISSAGLGVLLRLHKELLSGGRRLRLINVNSHIYDIFRFSGFDKVFGVERAGV